MVIFSTQTVNEPTGADSFLTFVMSKEETVAYVVAKSGLDFSHHETVELGS